MVNGYKAFKLYIYVSNWHRIQRKSGKMQKENRHVNGFVFTRLTGIIFCTSAVNIDFQYVAILNIDIDRLKCHTCSCVKCRKSKPSIIIEFM